MAVENNADFAVIDACTLNQYTYLNLVECQPNRW